MTRALPITALVFALSACAPPPGLSPPIGDDAVQGELTSEDDGKDDSARQLVYLNFGGDRLHHGASCSDARNNCSSLIAGTQDLQPFTLSSQWDRGKVVAAVTQCVSEYFSDMNVDFVTTRPSGGSYTMMMIGAIRAEQLGFQPMGGPYGRAPVDCGNTNKNDIGFILLEDSIDPDFDYLCRSTAHELAHTFGMQHTTGDETVHGTRVDAMCGTQQCFDALGAGSRWDFQNRAMTVEGGTACDGTTNQNTYARLMDTLGVRGR